MTVILDAILDRARVVPKEKKLLNRKRKYSTSLDEDKRKCTKIDDNNIIYTGKPIKFLSSMDGNDHFFNNNIFLQRL